MKRELTLQELADEAGISRVYLGLLERDKRNPTLNVCLKVSNALGLSFSGLLAKTER